MGWSVDTIDIVRRSVSYCWDDNLDWICMPDKFNLVLNGTSYRLTPASNVNYFGRYYAENGPDLYVEFKDDSDSNYTEEYWIVRTADGTEYRLGYKADSEQKLWRVYPTYQQEGNHQVYRWRVDQISDVHNNRIIFSYHEYTKGDNGRDYASYLANIYYNNYGNDQWASRVRFDSSVVGSEPGQAPIFRVRRRLDSVVVSHLGEVIREYNIAYRYGEQERWHAPKRITPYGLGGATSGQSLPATTFEYIERNNKEWELGGHQDHCNLDATPKPGHEEWITMCQYWGERFPYPRLARVKNGYGAVTELSYSDPMLNGSLPEKYYVVTQTQTWDGVRYVYDDTSAPRVTYSYSGRCWDSIGQGCVAPDAAERTDKLVGFSEGAFPQKLYQLEVCLL